METPQSMEDWTEQIKKDIGENRVFIYAKGEKNAAMCGFSDFEVRNIFSDPNIRPAICAFTNWPTTPQVFVDGQFIGGCDIVTEMYQNGELQKLLDEKPAASS